MMVIQIAINNTVQSALRIDEARNKISRTRMLCYTRTAVVVCCTHIAQWKNVSYEIEDFVETHLCKLRGILRSRVLRVLCDLIKNVSPFLRRTKSEPWNSVSVWICDCRYVCQPFTFVGSNLINSSMRGKTWITRWIGQSITRKYDTKYKCSLFP